MAFCNKCGNELPEGTKVCPSCGNNVSANDFSEKLQNLNDTADITGEMDPADIEKNKVMGILAYISILVLIPIFAAKDSKFARFHANQGLVLFALEMVWWVISAVVGGVIGSIPALGFITSILGIVNLVFLAFMIIGIINVANGKAKELPIIGKFEILK